MILPKKRARVEAADVVTTMIDAVIMYGNKGHHFGFGDPDSMGRVLNLNRITCVDGFSVSVIAGGGVDSIPRVPLCMCAMRDRMPDTGLVDIKAGSMGGWMDDVDCDYHGPYFALEVGLPNMRPHPWKAWRKYCEDPSRPTETIYSYVPADMVRELIVFHGGELEKPDSAYRE